MLTKIMEDSHFNSQYFWSPVPVQGQIENAMFLKQLKDQEKNTSFPSTHYQTTMLTVPKQEGGGQGQGGHQHPPHTQNITVVPVASTGIMTAAGLVITTPQGTQLVSPASSSQSFVSGHPTMIVSTLHTPDKKQEGGTPQVIVMPTPLKRGRKKKSTLGRGVLSGGHTLSAGNEALILAHLASGGQVVMSSQHYTTDPYDLANEDENHGGKDCNKTYRCRMCAVTFFSKSDMQIHSKSHTEAKPHKCPHCSKSFANSSYLAQHIRIHSGAKPYTCSYCQKSFRQLSHLQQHTRNHTESKPHKCPHCTKSFANSSYLAQHIRIHTGVKPYTCSFCQKSFRQLSHLQQHNRIAERRIWRARLHFSHASVGSTQETGLISVFIRAVRNPSHNSPTYSLTDGSTTRTNPSSARTVTVVTRTRAVWKSICPLTRSNTPSSTPVASATAHTPLRRTW
ncbi:zinc finger protein 384-like isoform X6 [Oncorhynchus tshawytscha]|uniref:zinc finger protein 384-like isoform X6 n=1 Tax=Oncorhynchus tshawytscha TaxID=74940 RepID=UPI001C3DC07E|nr:zinc finger protein 384-like isoform X6 [Oncorhynchus tshawytscha]